MAFSNVISSSPSKFDLNDSAEVVGSGDGAGQITVPHGDFFYLLNMSGLGRTFHCRKAERKF